MLAQAAKKLREAQRKAKIARQHGRERRKKGGRHGA
jgi:hypothetical protein